MKDKIRQASVAGAFYPNDPDELNKELSEKIVDLREKINAKVLISPHAGYFYSASCAGEGFGAVNIPDRVIILGVNHRGIMPYFAVDGYDKWAFPFGNVDIDIELRGKLLKDTRIFKSDIFAGNEEHSIEVQIPFLHFINPNVKILPILIAGTNYSEINRGGVEIAKLIKNIGDDVLVVASTDMSHYINAKTAKDKDSYAIEEIEKINPQGLFEVVINEKISMCGVLPVTMSLVIARELGAKNTKIFDYTNSGEAGGDFERVVSYLSMGIY